MGRARRFWFGAAVGAAVGGVAAGVVIGALASAGRPRAALRLAYPGSIGQMAEEVAYASDCLACHERADMHTCTTCHDHHGDATLHGVPFNGLVAVIGDVPAPGFVPVTELLPDAGALGAAVPLADALAGLGVEGFERVVLRSGDGGVAVLERDTLDEGARLLPWADGLRFADDDLHISTWLKGVTHVIVIGEDTPLTVGGEATSMGRLLAGRTVSVDVELVEVRLVGEDDGVERSARAGQRIEGVAVAARPGLAGAQGLVVTDGSGRAHTLEPADAGGAVLADLRGHTTLVLPARARTRWIEDVVAVSAAGDTPAASAASAASAATRGASEADDAPPGRPGLPAGYESGG